MLSTSFLSIEEAKSWGLGARSSELGAGMWGLGAGSSGLGAWGDGPHALNNPGERGASLQGCPELGLDGQSIDFREYRICLTGRQAPNYEK